MSRRTDHLERICNKLEYRFGSADALFMQAKAELETQRSYGQMEPLRHDWSKPYGVFIKAWVMDSLSKTHH